MGWRSARIQRHPSHESEGDDTDGDLLFHVVQRCLQDGEFYGPPHRQDSPGHAGARPHIGVEDQGEGPLVTKKAGEVQVVGVPVCPGRALPSRTR